MGILQGGSVIESVRASGVALQPEARVIVADPAEGAAFSLQDAIDETVAGNGDVIICKPGAFDITTTVLFNKAGIRVMASGPTRNPLVRGEYHALLSNASFTDGPVAKISAPCVIEGMGFVSRDNGGLFFAGAALLIGGDADANPFGVQILGCRFPKWGLDNRIGIGIEGSSDVLVEDCTFEGVTSDLESGIYVQGATQNLVIRRNLFRSCTYAITHGVFAGGGPHGMYQENTLEDSKLLEAQGNAATGIVAGNWLETATNATSYDDTVGALQALGIQFAGNHYSE